MRLLPFHDSIETASEIADPQIKPERMTDRLWLEAFLQRGFERLTASQRETLQLCLLEGYSLVEASERRKERLSNTRHHYYRRIAALRSALDLLVSNCAQVK